MKFELQETVRNIYHLALCHEICKRYRLTMVTFGTEILIQRGEKFCTLKMCVCVSLPVKTENYNVVSAEDLLLIKFVFDCYKIGVLQFTQSHRIVRWWISKA